MESSFKKGYDKTVNADGSFELSFKSERVSAKSASGFALLMIIILFPTSCAVTLPVAHMFSSGDWAQVSKPLWASLALILYIVVLYYITKSKTKISVKPDIGIIINGKNLPFKEISQIGTISYPGASSKKNAAFVYADTHGTQVKLSKYIPLELAEAIVNELKAASGVNWK